MEQYFEYKFRKVYKMQELYNNQRLWDITHQLSKKNRYLALRVWGVYSGNITDPECPNRYIPTKFEIATHNLRQNDYDGRDYNDEANLELDIRTLGRLFSELCEEFEVAAHDLIEL